MKILIVEDDLVIAESLANELSKWNYEVNVVENFDQIMEDFRENRTTTSIIRYQLTYTQWISLVPRNAQRI